MSRKHRMTQGQFNDYEAASHGGPTVRANWEALKKDPGVEIIPESERDPHGVGDLSVMFMYPNEIKALDLSGLGVKIDESQVTDIVVDGVDPKDHPDYADAFIQSATYFGRPMSDNEIDQLSKDFVHEAVLKSLT